ncbi:hypothetical protein FNV43_RR14607 [Rhamnella rubrinervis]|uniref:Uncharacterized protein n=1 Tax=Rhamnella rubrinervis TaxID=2594499 RepID=A0A8K0H3G8_9ROSA|nr:hypothetical protein FNV43_RR14607 [Rhamnella rubrinervis]
MDNITASEIAGLGVGTLLLCATFAAPKVDALIAASQRSSLRMCKKCGDLRMIACSKCRGVGLIREGATFGLTFVDDLYESFGAENSKARSIACPSCQAKGHFCCPDCSKSSLV